jgi:hypothetical protein
MHGSWDCTVLYMYSIVDLKRGQQQHVIGTTCIARSERTVQRSQRFGYEACHSSFVFTLYRYLVYCTEYGYRDASLRVCPAC